MRKQNAVILVIALILHTYPNLSFGHTINQHLETLYGDIYLPFFIAASLLPFIGLGMLAYNPSFGQQTIQVKWPFLIGLAIGILPGFFVADGDFALLVNKTGILACGFLLLFEGNAISRRLNILFLLMGGTLGFENGMYISHSHEFLWLFILIPITGLLLFMVLNNIRFIGHPGRKLIRYAASILLILSGLVLILLT